MVLGDDRICMTRNVLVIGLVVGVAWMPRLAAVQDRAAFSTRSELVVLHVTVNDRHGRYVGGLPNSAFNVLEEGRPQLIQFFQSEDAPVTVGLLIDNSGSMRGNRDLMLAAAEAFVTNSNPQDEVFALTFNETIRAALPSDAPFTSEADVLRAALSGIIVPRGRTALFDAIAAGRQYLGMGRYERKVLVVVSDGGDNASHETFQHVLRQTEASNAVLYAVAIADPLEPEARTERLEQLAQASGGLAFRPRDSHAVADVLKRVAVDIRSAYSLGYVPSDTTGSSAFRRLGVIVKSADGRRLVARTRAGYLAGVESAPSTR
jgi:VWFA-related protein